MKNRARLSILHYVMHFSISKKFGDLVYGGLADYAFVPDDHDNRAIPGDLVALSSAHVSQYYLGWLVARSGQGDNFCEKFTIESLETGELCDWSNVGISYLWRPTVLEHPEWRWTDRQHELNDRWLRCCYKKCDAYTYLPICAEFLEGTTVSLGVRVRHNWSPERVRKEYPDWRKVTKAQMVKFYTEASSQLEGKKDPV